jgi:hypothetical protein
MATNTSWKTLLKGDPTSWLLQESNPSVRYLTLLNLLEKKSASAEARHARQQIMRSGVVPKILRKQGHGAWNEPGRFYVDKYKGTVWQLIILAEHDADGRNRQVRNACEYILERSQDPKSGGFSCHESGDGRGGRRGEVIPCLTGNMVWSLLKLGFAGDERVEHGIDWIAKYQRFDDGARGPARVWPYDRYEMCWGSHSCHMGVVKSLKALSLVPAKSRSKAVRTALKAGSDYLLAHHIHKQSHHLSRTARPGWVRLQFPLMYQTDILEVATILLDLGVRDARMQEAVDKIASKQREDGTWTLEETFNGRFQVDIEAKGRPSKWITYRAMNVLKKYSK